MRLLALRALVLALGPALGCAEITEQHRETILSRQAVELAAKRNPSGDTTVVDPRWDGGVLLLRVLREYSFMSDSVERQTVETKTIRTPSSWAPAIAEGAIAVAAIGVFAVGSAKISACKGDYDSGCGLDGSFMELGALGALIPATIGAGINLVRATDIRTVGSRDVTTGTVKRSTITPITGEQIVLRWADGFELSAVSDLDGVARFSIPPAKHAPGSPPAALFINGERVRSIDVVVVPSD